MEEDLRIKLNEYKSGVEEDIDRRIEFIRQQVHRANMQGLVIGISGGIDSAVVAALAVKALGADRVLGIWMPAHSNPQHGEDAKLVADTIGLKMITTNLDRASSLIFEVLVQGLQEGQVLSPEEDLSTLTKGNTKARLRMATLYAIAGQLNYLVVGTCNRTEIHLGYETKGGDQICDFNPVASLVKGQIQILAQALGIPDRIIDKAPSADLWEGQTDEEEMGFTYEEVDSYILTGKGSEDLKAKVDKMHQRSQHKREMPPGL